MLSSNQHVSTPLIPARAETGRPSTCEKMHKRERERGREREEGGGEGGREGGRDSGVGGRELVVKTLQYVYIHMCMQTTRSRSHAPIISVEQGHLRVIVREECFKGYV
jgi:hypothetical protein